MRDVTLCFPIRDGSILLGLKKRGFGTGKWNGFGGKVENETVEEAAARELAEECGLRAQPSDLVFAGRIEFSLPDVRMRIHVYRTEVFEGEPVETEEMKPRWYGFDQIPYASMWEDDRHWLPHLLDGRTVFGSFVFDERGITDVELRLR